MVQALRELILLDDYDEASLTEALSRFKCAYEDKDAEDVIAFLSNEAIKNEKLGISRTYLWINDEAWRKGEPQIDGYFTIALKVLYFQNVEKELIEEVFGDPKIKNCPAYLIGQLARGAGAPKGKGRDLLKTALSYIVEASEVVGGRFVYLDCSESRQAYYESNGFKFLKKKKDSDLIQMYCVL